MADAMIVQASMPQLRYLSDFSRVVILSFADAFASLRDGAAKDGKAGKASRAGEAAKTVPATPDDLEWEEAS